MPKTRRSAHPADCAGRSVRLERVDPAAELRHRFDPRGDRHDAAHGARGSAHRRRPRLNDFVYIKAYPINTSSPPPRPRRQTYRGSIGHRRRSSTQVPCANRVVPGGSRGCLEAVVSYQHAVLRHLAHVLYETERPRWPRCRPTRPRFARHHRRRTNLRARARGSVTCLNPAAVILGVELGVCRTPLSPVFASRSIVTRNPRARARSVMCCRTRLRPSSPARW